MIIATHIWTLIGTKTKDPPIFRIWAGSGFSLIPLISAFKIYDLNDFQAQEQGWEFFFVHLYISYYDVPIS